MIDNQVYNYHKLGGKKQNNRLYSIFDDAAITSGKDLPSGQDAFDDEDLLNNNYRYNELGELVYDKQMGIDEITWGNNGKIQSVTHSEASGKYNLKFDYNHTGKRIAKQVYNQNNTLLRSEYYTRDASDNVMAVYRLEVDEQNQEVSYRLRERHIYGSSMLGIDRLELELIDPIAPNNTLNHIVGLKSYTGSNHLGNVLTTFSDKKLPVDENSDGMIDYYQPHIISSSDYAPFGAQLAERSFFSETYPNSFNDKRDDPELGDWQDYGMRMYSTWQRRFPTPDPLIVYGQEYPELSTYQFASNSPIMNIDLDGLEGTSALINEEFTGSIYGYKTTVSNPTNEQMVSGVWNVTMGALGIAGSVAYITGTKGAGAAFGGVLALDMSIGQLTIGISQIVDASVAMSKNSNTKMPKGSNIPGLISYGLNSEYAGLIDASFGMLPSVLTGGVGFLKTSWSNYYNMPNLKNAIEAIDATFTTGGFVGECVKTSFGITNNDKVFDYSVSFSSDIVDDVDKGIRTTQIRATYSYSVGKSYDKKVVSQSFLYSKEEKIEN